MSTVEDLISEQDELKSFQFDNCFLSPDRWKTVSDLNRLVWCSVPFTASNVALVPDAPGIYSFFITPGFGNHPQSYLGYIGKTSRTLKERYIEYIREANNIKGRPKILRLLYKWQEYLTFTYTIVDKEDPHPLEKRLNDAFLPPFNDDYSVEVNRVIGAF